MLNQFKQDLEREEEGVLIPLNGRNGKPHKNPDGTQPKLRVAGPYSAPVRAAEQKNSKRLIQSFKKKGDDADLDDSTLTRLSAAVIGWENLLDDDGTPVPYSPANARKVLEALPWVRDDVAEALEEYAGFFGSSST
jgi:hypothetical protein